MDEPRVRVRVRVRIRVRVGVRIRVRVRVSVSVALVPSCPLPRAGSCVRNARQAWARLGCHGMRYVHPAPEAGRRNPVRTVHGALGASHPVRPVRTQRGRLVRVARTYPTEAPGRTCQLSLAPVHLARLRLAHEAPLALHEAAQLAAALALPRPRLEQRREHHQHVVRLE